MEHIETPDDQIQADFARRVGRVLLHYEAAMERSDPQDSYEATLTICLLQALLTNCIELIKSRNKQDLTGLTAIAGKSIAEVKVVRNAVSIGGDSDTIAAIAGSVAQARFGIPEEIAAKTWSYLPRDMREVLTGIYGKV